MKQADKDALLAYLDNEAGPIPTRMNDAQGVIAERLGVAAKTGDVDAVFMAITKLAQCQSDTTKMGFAFQRVRDAVAAIVVDDEVVTPPKPPTGPLPDLPVPPHAGAVGGRWKLTAAETPKHFLFDGPANRLSIAVADGKQVWIGYSKNPGEFIEGQASASSGTAAVFGVPAGRWYVNFKLSPGMGGYANGDISAY
jgi:hypothetical protein